MQGVPVYPIRLSHYATVRVEDVIKTNMTIASNRQEISALQTKIAIMEDYFEKSKCANVLQTLSNTEPTWYKAEIERLHGVISSLHEEKTVIQDELDAVRKENDDLKRQVYRKKGVIRHTRQSTMRQKYGEFLAKEGKGVTGPDRMRILADRWKKFKTYLD